MENISIPIKEFKLLLSAVYQLQSITEPETEYIIKKRTERAKETIKELKDLNNIYKY